jgi:hypothetical protein
VIQNWHKSTARLVYPPQLPTLARAVGSISFPGAHARRILHVSIDLARIGRKVDAKNVGRRMVDIAPRNSVSR